MISDKEARQYILQQLYNAGYRYLARDATDKLFAFCTRPEKREQYAFWVDKPTDFNAKHTFIVDCLCFKDIRWVDEEPLDIAKELGIIDWTKVPKDTKVLVWDVEGERKSKRHFSHYEAQGTNYPLSQLYKSRREFEEMMMEAIQEHMEALEEELITLLFKGRKAYKELKAQREN